MRYRELKKNYINFDDYWKEENKLWELSMQESFRQRDERHKRLEKFKRNVHGEYIDKGNDCC